MMTTLKNKIDSVHDINRFVRVLSNYVWIGAGTLFVCYLYFVGSLTFSIIKQQELEHTIKDLVSVMSTQELSYLSTQKSLTQQYATSLGLIPTTNIAFVPSERAVAFNVGR